MSVDVGSAVGYLDLDIKGFLDGLKSAQEAAAEGVEKVSQTWEDTFKDLGKSITDIGKNFSLYISTPIIGAGSALLKFGSDFETEMKNISAITGMTGEELATFEEGIKNIALTTGTSQAELARAGKMVAEAGGDMTTMLAQLEAGNNLAIASQTDLATTLDMVGSTMKTFGLEADDARAVVDSLASVTTLANTTLTDIGQAFVNCGGSAANLGVSVDEVNAVLVTFANAGLKGGAAGTAFNGVLRNLSAPTQKAQEELDNLNVALYDNEGAARNTFDVMKDLETALSGLTEEQKARSESIIFDTVSLKGWNNITSEGVDSIRELAGQLSESVNAYDGLGQAAGMAGVQNESLAATLKSIYPVLEELGKVVLENLKPSIVWLAETLKEWFKWFTELPAPVQTTVIAIAAFAAAIGPLLVVVGTFITSIGTVVGAFNTIIAIAPAVGTAWAVMTGPIGLAIIAIAAVGAAIWYFWDDIKAFFEGFGTAWSEFWEGVGVLLSDVWDGILAIGQQILDWIYDFWKEFGERFTKFGEALWTWITGVGKMIWEFLTGIGKTIWNWISGAAKSIYDGCLNIGKQIVNGVWQGIVSMATWFFNSIKNFFAGIIKTATSVLGINSPSRLFADEVGKWIPLGIAAGFEDAMPKALRDMQSALDTGMRMLAADDVVLDYAFAPAKNRSGGGWDDGGGFGAAGQQNTGGNTYNFYSPEPIDAAAARREIEQLNRRMAFGL